jgi:hypothetical protein
MSSYFDGHTTRGLTDLLKNYWNGYLILFDIVDSTGRKRRYPERWFAQTDVFYKAIHKLAEDFRLFMESEPAFGSLDPQHRDVIVKFIGDSGFIFMLHSYSDGTAKKGEDLHNLSHAVIKKILDFRLNCHEQNSLEELRLKSVVTYIEGVRPVYFKDPMQHDLGTHKETQQPDGHDRLDILGRGIDFTHRLERYAGNEYIVVNTLMAKSLLPERSQNSASSPPPGLSDKVSQLEIDGASYYLIECCKRIRGWERASGETFFVLAPEPEEALALPSASPERDDMLVEMLHFRLRFEMERMNKLNARVSNVTSPNVDELVSPSASDGDS